MPYEILLQHVSIVPCLCVFGISHFGLYYLYSSTKLSIIKKELQKFSPEKVVWDIEDLSKQPPWGNDISKDITDLSNYFVTSDGNDFLTVFSHALEKAKEVNAEIVIKSM